MPRTAKTRSPPSSPWPRSSTPSAMPTAPAAWPRKSSPKRPATSRARRRSSWRRSADPAFSQRPAVRWALGISYMGQAYDGWQSQPSGRTVQDHLEAALSQFAAQPVSTVCAGRTDAGVHGLMQVVHFDTGVHREPFSWVRGTNSFLPPDIAVQWAQQVPDEFHSRASAIARRYAYVLLESPV